MKNLKNWQINLLLFIGLAIVVGFIQYTLLQPVFKQGLTGDDLQLLFAYKTYGPNPPLNLTDALTIWKFRGAYTTSQVYYIGILESIFGMNYLDFHIINVILKTLATITVFPLILAIFKRRLLACLVTLLYAISYSSTGSLQLVVFGTEHLAIFFMFLFFIAYYYSFDKVKNYHQINILTILVLPLLLLATFLISPIRIYPLFILLPLIEILVWLRLRSFRAFLRAFTILMVMYLPILLVSLMAIEPTSRNLKGPFNLYDQMVTNGNWQLILTPFSGLGYLFATDTLLKLMSNNILSMILFYGLLSMIIAWIVSKKTLKFFFLIFFTNLLIEKALFLFGYPIKFLPQTNFGVYALIVGIFVFFEWLSRKENVLLLTLTGGIVYSVIFLWSIWLILGYALNFSEATHRYLVMSTPGASLVIGSLLVLFYDKIKQFKIDRYERISIILITLLLFQTYQFSNKEVSRYFNALLAVGAGAKEQQLMQAKLIKELGSNYNFNSDPVLIYFDESSDSQNVQFYETTLNYRCPDCMWIHLVRNSDFNGCMSIVYDEKKLKSLLILKDNRIEFESDSLCIEHKYVAKEDIPSLGFTQEVNPNDPRVLVYEVGRKKVFYKTENFYAFGFKNRDLVNIKQKVLNDLESYFLKKNLIDSII